MIDNIINNGSFERNYNPDAPAFDGTPAIPRALCHFIRYGLDATVHPEELYVLGGADHRGMQLLMAMRGNAWNLTPGQWRELRASAPNVARIGGREHMLYRR